MKKSIRMHKKSMHKRCGGIDYVQVYFVGADGPQWKETGKCEDIIIQEDETGDWNMEDDT